MPAMPRHDFLTQNRGKRHIKPKTFENCVSTNIVIKSATVNTKCYQPIKCKSVLYENSFSSKTIIDLNNLKDKCCVRRDNWRLQNSSPAPGQLPPISLSLRIYRWVLQCKDSDSEYLGSNNYKD